MYCGDLYHVDIGIYWHLITATCPLLILASLWQYVCMSSRKLILAHIEAITSKMNTRPIEAKRLFRISLLQELGIPQRTLDRQLLSLQHEGLIKEKKIGVQKAYFYVGPSAKREFNLTHEEIEALLVAERFMPAFTNTPLELSFRSAVKKVLAASAESADYDVSRVDKYQAAHIPHMGYIGKDVFSEVTKAIDSCRHLTIEYYRFDLREGAKFKAKKHDIEPYQLFYKDSRWYLFAFHIESKEFSLYALSRIKSIVLLESIFKPQIKAFNSYIKKMKDSDLYSVECSISSRILPYIYEMNTWENGRPFLKDRWFDSLTGKMAFQEGAHYANLPANIKYKVDFSDFDWKTLAQKFSFKKWVLGWGKEATLVGPEPYVKEIYDEIKVMEAHYRDRLIQIEKNRADYADFSLRFKDNSEKTLLDLIAPLTLSQELQQIAFEIVCILVKQNNYQPDKGSLLDLIKYQINVHIRKEPVKDKYGTDY